MLVLVFFGQESMNRKDYAAAGFIFTQSGFSVTTMLKCKKTKTKKQRLTYIHVNIRITN